MINFMNLSTARSMERGKEVGIRKSIGAYRSSLIYQFLGESMIIVYRQGVSVFLGIILMTGLLAGSYPALLLSGFNPALILKGITRSHTGGAGLRKALVVFQFTLSIALIAGTMIVYFQMSHLLEKDLGFDKEQMLVLDYNYDGVVNQKSEVLKSEMEKNPSILSIAFSRSVPGSYFPHAGTYIENPEGQLEERGQPIFQVGMDFVTHFGLELIAGRTYSRDFPTDWQKIPAVGKGGHGDRCCKGF
jgi:putative ABC transport system permease protein